jgi:hypothetical protein
MKFSVEVETDCKKYDRAGTESPSIRQLTWNIKVDIHQSLAEKENEGLPVKKVGIVEPVKKAVGIVEPTQRKHSMQPKSLSQQNNEEDRLKRKSVAEIDTDTRVRKQSKLEREEELVRMAMRKSSRKVSRMGEWLIIQERVGLLTTQNGTQQIHEKRIRINEEDLMTFCEQES